MKIIKFLAILLGVPIVVLLLWVIIQYQLIFGHQIAQGRYCDRSFLSVLDQQYAQKGIVLLVRSKSEIIKVQRQQDMPFVRFVYIGQIQYKVVNTKTPEVYILVIPYEFSPRGEWYIELFSADGHWLSMSPYFGDVPDLSQETWDWLWNLRKDTELEVQKLFPEFKSNNVG